ncbi:HEAT repeat domain-containing protein [Sorangium sp. So ce693]|uniref:HEAT repeat domain-containing protein n=1 Tax=Sorangium sp. So ce693 TaxID=3133318 RepID=UPI003F631615
MQEVAGNSAELQAVLAGLKSQDPRARRLSARRFGTLRVSDPFGVLSPLLECPDPGTRLAAVDALEDVIDERAIPILLEMAATDTSQDVREAALQELNKYRSEDIFRLLVSEAFRPHPSRRPRQIIAEQLKNYNSETSINTLLKLTQDPDVYVQERAIESLFKLNRPRLLEFWASVEHSWEGTYWGELARTALHRLPSSSTDEIRTRRNRAIKRTTTKHAPTRQRIGPPPSPPAEHLANKVQQPTHGRPPRDRAAHLNETLRRVSRQFALDLWPLLYRCILEEARNKLVTMGGRQTRTASRAMTSEANKLVRRTAPEGMTPRQRRSESPVAWPPTRPAAPTSAPQPA